MSDQELSPVTMVFPDGTSQTYRGTQDQVDRQAKAYWSKRAAASRIGASSKATVAKADAAAKVATSTGPTDKEIKDFRLKYFNNPIANIQHDLTGSLSGYSIPEQTAYHIALNTPDAASWQARLKLMAPVSQAAIQQRIQEIRDLNRPGKVDIGPGGVPFERYANESKIDQDKVRPREPHDALQDLLLGPEKARQLPAEKGFEAEALRLATGLVDPDNLAMMVGLGPIGKVGGSTLSNTIAATFAGMMGTNAAMKFKEGDTGGGLADLTLLGLGLGGHEAAKRAMRGKPSPSYRPMKATVTGTYDTPPEPKGLPKAPPPPPPKSPAGLGPSPGEPGTSENPHTTPPPPLHPEVEKFNTYADSFDSRIKEQADIVEAKKRIAELNAKRKMTQAEKLEFGKLVDMVDKHTRGLENFRERYKAASNKTLRMNLGSTSIGDISKPTGRSQLFDMVRKGLEAGHTTFERLFPEAEASETPEASTKTTAGKRSRNRGMLNLGPGAPGSPQERFTQWLRDHEGDIAGAIKFAAGDAQPSNQEESADISNVSRETVPPYEMSAEEINRAYEAQRSHEKGAAIRVFGASAAAQYEAAQRTANSSTLAASDPKAKAADKLIDSMESGLTEAQRKDLFGIGNTGPSAEDYRDYRQAIGYLGWESPQDLGHSIRTHITNIGEETDPAKMTHSQQVSYAVIRNAMEGAYRKGWNLVEVEKAALENAAERFYDPKDAIFMLRRFMKKPEKIPRFSALEDDDAIQVESPNAGVLRKGGPELGLSRLEPGDQGSQEPAGAGEAEALPQNVDEGRGGQNTSKVKRRKLPMGFQSGAINVGPLPPKSGAGPVGRLAHHGAEVLNAANVMDAAHGSAEVRGQFIEDQLYEGLDPVQRDALDEWLLGNRFEHEANRQTDPAQAAAIRAHPQYVTPADMAALQAFPGVQAALDRYKNKIKPIIDKMSAKAGVSAQAISEQSPYYIRLVPEDVLNASAGSSGPPRMPMSSRESRGRPKSTGARKAAKIGARVYATNAGAILRHVIRDVEPKAALNDLWRTLHNQGLIKVQPSGAAGRGWKPPDGYVGDEIQGKFSSMPADIRAHYGGKTKVYLPQDVVQTMDEISAPREFSGHRGVETFNRISRALISTTLGLNIPAVPFHIYRQTAMFRASTALADAKRNPTTVIANSIPLVGTAVKAAVIASRNADDPLYREVYQYLVSINAISPRSMEGILGNLKRIPLAERWNVMIHDSMFGVPHGRGVNGWAGRIAVEAFLARARFEKTFDPERDREFVGQFGAYMRRLSPLFQQFANSNPFVRTHVPRIITSTKLALGITGLKTIRGAGESEAHFRMRQSLDTIGAFALGVAVPVVGFMVLNYLLSGHWPWENEEGHQLDLDLGNGHYIPIGRVLTELQPMIELSGMITRLRRGSNTAAFGKRPSAPQSSPIDDSVQDFTVGAANTGMGLYDSPALNAAAALINKRPYVQYDKRRKDIEFMRVSPSSATAAQRAFNTAMTITGASSFVPVQGYGDEGQFNIAQSIMDYLTQKAIKSTPPKKTKFGRAN